MFIDVFAQGATVGGAKRAKVESWERSVGTLGGGGTLGSLVVRKKPASFAKPYPVAPPVAHKSQTGISFSFGLLSARFF